MGLLSKFIKTSVPSTKALLKPTAKNFKEFNKPSLVDPFTRDVIRRQREEAEQQTRRAGEARSRNVELTAERDGLKWQLSVASHLRQTVDFENSDSASYRRYLRG